MQYGRRGIFIVEPSSQQMNMVVDIYMPEEGRWKWTIIDGSICPEREHPVIITQEQFSRIHAMWYDRLQSAPITDLIGEHI